MTAGYSVVVPTLGRPSLRELLDDLVRQTHPPAEVVIVDDRPFEGAGSEALGDGLDGGTARVVRGYGRGPAAARNRGWRVTDSEWVAFLDDDVRLPDEWSANLAADLGGCGARVGGSQGNLEVPLPSDRKPTDWERGTAGLAHAVWPTADMAYRRTTLVEVGGFDERFPRAYREDADLALRVRAAGWDLVRGARTTVHPVRDVDDWVSVRVQRGNADDALMRALHGRDWRTRARAPRGALRTHLLTVLAGLVALTGRRGAALVWLGLTARFAWKRIAPGPGTTSEVRRMVLTSVAIPPAAIAHRLRGAWRHRRRLGGPGAPAWPPPLRAVLFDRDGTLVHDVPYNGVPALVDPVPDARAVLEHLRTDGLAVGVISNQSGIARGMLTRTQVDAVNARVEAELGPFATWEICPHGADDGCGCRKPRPGMVLAAARTLGIPVERCAVIGDIGADVEAALAAGARPVLVPTPQTRAQEVRDAPFVADDLAAALRLLGVGGRS